MTDRYLNRVHGVESLLRVARAEADALRVDLSDIEAAKASTESALAAIDDDIRKEEALAGGGEDLARYIDAARNRRCNLTTTLKSLAISEERTRGSLEAAFLEIKKLEQLIDAHHAAERRRAAKADAARLDDVGTAASAR